MPDSFLNIKTNQKPLEGFPEEINEKFFTVSEISRGIRTSLEHKFSNIGVLGEISNVRKPSSGHIYLSLKKKKEKETKNTTRRKKDRRKKKETKKKDNNQSKRKQTKKAEQKKKEKQEKRHS